MPPPLSLPNSPMDRDRALNRLNQGSVRLPEHLTNCECCGTLSRIRFTNDCFFALGFQELEFSMVSYAGISQYTEWTMQPQATHFHRYFSCSRPSSNVFNIIAPSPSLVPPTAQTLRLSFPAPPHVRYKVRVRDRSAYLEDIGQPIRS